MPSILLLLILPLAAADLVIEEDSIVVNSQEYAFGDVVDVSPGDEVTIRFAVSNTFPDAIIPENISLGHVSFSATVGDIPAEAAAELAAELPQFQICAGADCPEGVWVLRPGQSATTDLTFTVPLGIDPALPGFEVELGVFYDDRFGVFDDSFPVSFEIVREDVSVEIVDGTIAVEPLTCSSTAAQLSFSVINNGDFPITPEIKVYNQRAVESSLNRAGEFTSFSATPTISAERTLSDLDPGDIVPVFFSLDLSGLPAGAQQLYIYVVNPYFDAAAFYISDQGQASFTKSNCIASSSPSATSVNVLQGIATSFSVTLSDSSLEDSVTWTVTRAGTDVDTVTGSDTYTFNQATTGTYTVRVELGDESRTWTVTVSAPAPAALSLAPITIENVRAGQSANATITVTNTGANMAIDSLTAVLEGVNARYQARIVGTLPATLAAGASSTDLQIQLRVPTDEASGAHTIGNLVVQGTDTAGTAINATQAITLNPRSFLAIESVELNGNTAGDLTLEEDNEFEIEVRNEYPEDMNNIVVTVTILDVDGEDLEEESEEFDLDSLEDETVTLSFNLREENVDENQYTVQIEVEGEADDNTRHRTVQTMTVDVERENHKVIVQKATIGSSSLQCTRQTSLQVIIGNIGENDEDDVEIKVRNALLGIDLNQADIELEDFAGSDNDYRTTFTLDLADAAPSSYTLTVEAYRDGTLDDTEEIVVQVLPCSTLSSMAGEAGQLQAGEELQAELQRQLQARQQQETQPQLRSSFRDGDTYVLSLGILAVLLFVAVIMAAAILIVKKR